MALSENDIAALIKAEEKQCLGYLGEGSRISDNRKLLIDYYNQKPFDVVEGQSQIVTSDVADVVNGILPNMIRMFTQSQQLGKFESSRPEYDEEAEHKTVYSNWVFFDQHDGTKILHDMIKDAMLQYTGVVKVYHDDSIDAEEEEFTTSEVGFYQAKQDGQFEIKEHEILEDGQHYIKGDRINSRGRQKIACIPPDELLISNRARDFIDPPFIGQRTPKTRSELIQMGFEKSIVDTLKADSSFQTEVDQARNDGAGSVVTGNPTSDKSKDIIYLGEYYTYMDADGDGISELWQVFYADEKILEKNRVDEHPYAVFVPIPMPHEPIGSCPADQAADAQRWKTHLVRQANNNCYANNKGRIAVNDRVNLDDLMCARTDSIVRIDGHGPIGDSILPLGVSNQIPAVLELVGYVDSTIEKRTGVTSYNQGLDTESLNKTATGFQGIRDMSQMRIEQMAIMLANGPLTKVFNRIVKLAAKYQDEETEIRVNGQPMKISPRDWRYKANCAVKVGSGSGDKQAKIANLQQLMANNLDLIERGSPCADWNTYYHAYRNLIVEIGLKDATPYANDPSRPDQLLAQENMALRQQLEQLQMVAQERNQLAEAERTKGEFEMVKQQQKQAHEMNMKMADMEQKDKYHDDEMALKLSDLEMKSGKNVQGALI